MADGFIILTVANDSQFADFCDLTCCQKLPQYPRFTTNQASVPCGPIKDHLAPTDIGKLYRASLLTFVRFYLRLKH
ncbi:hypothetical protein [uncultured Paraglaciecola sp.]|uniref:hypothetical protein n=1 Tax=uncultured Paraglaciecola sp. TaxID=1765024 RepID=UPI0030D9C592